MPARRSARRSIFRLRSLMPANETFAQDPGSSNSTNRRSAMTTMFSTSKIAAGAMLAGCMVAWNSTMPMVIGSCSVAGGQRKQMKKIIRAKNEQGQGGEKGPFRRAKIDCPLAQEVTGRDQRADAALQFVRCHRRCSWHTGEQQSGNGQQAAATGDGVDPTGDRGDRSQ